MGRFPAFLAAPIISAGIVFSAACSGDPVTVAPPQDLKLTAEPDGSIRVTWRKSADDDAGLRLVRHYQVLRAPTAAGPFAPFASAKADVSDKRLEAVIDTSALPGRVYWYRVVAIVENERTTPTLQGGKAAVSAARGPMISHRLQAQAAAKSAAGAVAPVELRVAPPARDSGEHLELRWNTNWPANIVELHVLRAESADGPFQPFFGNAFPADSKTATIAVPSSGTDYWIALFAVPTVGEATLVATVGPVQASAALFDPERMALLALIVLSGAALFYFVRKARREGAQMFIRRIPGVDALEEAIGRATEMGRPVLYVPGVEESLSTQTIATILVLGHVSERVARYGAQLRVSVNFPMTLPLAQEAVKQGYLRAGRPDAYHPNQVQWVSSEQFAFTAGTNGIILREKPATNIYLGRFYAESLILAETGFVNRAIQIAGTAEIPQLPFFVAACDYTLIGEELYAMSAYLSRQPALLGTLKGGDVVKLVAVACILIGSALGLGGWLPGLVELFAPAS